MAENYKSDSTKCVHAGVGKEVHGAVVPPIYQVSTFSFENAQHGADLFAGKKYGHIYSRMSNPTRNAFENALAAVENGHKALACGSGMAAIHTCIAALVKQGDHIISSKTVYGPTSTLLENIFAKFGIGITFVDTSNLEQIQEAITDKTKVIYIETPANPTLVISDLVEVSKLAKKHNILTIVDNTFMSPVLQKPLDLGIDISVHSLTKYINGHADVVGGAIIVKDEEMYRKMRITLNQTGGVLGPMDSFLVHRGLKTLAIRMKKHCENAQKVAEYLEAYPKIEWVRYPGLESHPQYELSKKQSLGPSGMIAFEVKGGVEAGETLMNSVKLAGLAVSLGGVETLIEHPASMTHASMGKELRLKADVTDGLVRLSVGIEDVDEIIADLAQALDKV